MRKIFDSGLASPDEREELWRLLKKNKVRFYEIPDSGRTHAAWWVKHDANYRKAREIIEEFQREYVTRSREDYERRLENKWQGSHARWLLAKATKHKKGLLFGILLVVFLVWYTILYLRLV